MFLFRFFWWCFSFVVRAVSFTAIGLIALVYAEGKIEDIKQRAASHNVSFEDLSDTVKYHVRTQVIALQKHLDEQDARRL